MNVRVDLVTDEQNLCGEAPLWDHRESCLFWVDQDNPGLFKYSPVENRVYTLDRSVQISGITLNRRGGLVAGGRNGLFIWDEDHTCRTILDTYEGMPLVFNDLIAGPGGRIYGGTLYWGESGMVKKGNLYRVEPDGTVEVEDEGMILSNGLAFSTDNRTLYFSDSGCRSIFSYDVNPESGGLSHRRVFASFFEDEGIPDGITADAEGFIWAALWYGGEIVRIDPDGDYEPGNVQLITRQENASRVRRPKRRTTA